MPSNFSEKLPNRPWLQWWIGRGIEFRQSSWTPFSWHCQRMYFTCNTESISWFSYNCCWQVFLQRINLDNYHPEVWGPVHCLIQLLTSHQFNVPFIILAEKYWDNGLTLKLAGTGRPCARCSVPRTAVLYEGPQPQQDQSSHQVCLRQTSDIEPGEAGGWPNY